ncbi:hypothetical protein V8E52_000283 [Russula decolorans]
MESAINASKQDQWQELLSRIQDLARATKDENAQLVHKVKELEVEVTVWKQAHSTASATRESKPLGQKNVALCMIDGTRSVFSTSYITEGEAGGKRAAQEIIRGIVDHLADTSSLQDPTVKVSISIYISKTRLRNDLASICPREQFDKFFVGLNEAPYLNIVEVNNKRDADKKIQEHLQLFADLPQTVRVFFSGGNGSEYLSIMPTLEACNAKDKLVILRSYAGLSNGTSARIPSLMLAGLFMKNTPAPATPFSDPWPLPVEEGNETGTRTPSPKTYNLPRRQSVIDPSLPLFKQNPPPCNEYYLMQTCSKEGRCRYSHEYDLTDEQLAALANSAKQSPCWFLNNNRECPYGMSCCWGHVCPFGVTCHYSLRDRCRFKGEGMHRPLGTQTSHNDWAV